MKNTFCTLKNTHFTYLSNSIVRFYLIFWIIYREINCKWNLIMLCCGKNLEHNNGHKFTLLEWSQVNVKNGERFALLINRQWKNLLWLPRVALDEKTNTKRDKNTGATRCEFFSSFPTVLLKCRKTTFSIILFRGIPFFAKGKLFMRFIRENASDCKIVELSKVRDP